jgi:hypothetical protein
MFIIWDEMTLRNTEWISKTIGKDEVNPLELISIWFEIEIIFQQISCLNEWVLLRDAMRWQMRTQWNDQSLNSSKKRSPTHQEEASEFWMKIFIVDLENAFVKLISSFVISQLSKFLQLIFKELFSWLINCQENISKTEKNNRIYENYQMPKMTTFSLLLFENMENWWKKLNELTFCW